MWDRISGGESYDLADSQDSLRSILKLCRLEAMKIITDLPELDSMMSLPREK